MFLLKYETTISLALEKLYNMIEKPESKGMNVTSLNLKLESKFHLSINYMLIPKWFDSSNERIS